MKVEGSNCLLTQDLSYPLARFVMKFPCAQTIKPRGETYFKLCVPTGEMVSSSSKYNSDESHHSIGCPHWDPELSSLGGQMCVCVPKLIFDPGEWAQESSLTFPCSSPALDFAFVSFCWLLVWMRYIRCRLIPGKLGCHIFDPLKSFFGYTLESCASKTEACSLPSPTLVSYIFWWCQKPLLNTFTCQHQLLSVQW